MSFSPYWKGYDAYWEGEFYNPYNKGSASYHAYNQGWIDATQKAADSKALGVFV